MNDSTATFSGFARILGCKPSAVTALRQADRLVLTEDGKAVKVEESLQRLRETADPARHAVSERHADDRGAPLAHAASDPELSEEGEGDGSEEGDGSGFAGFQSSRAKREHYAAASAQLDYETAIGKLINADAVANAAGEAITLLRAGLERLPSVMAPQLAPVSDEGEVRTMLAEYIEHLLEEMSRKFALLAKVSA